LVQLAQTVSLDNRELQEMPDLRDNPVHPVLRDPLEILAHRDSLELLDSRVQTGSQETREW
jgi:hypothetical protein